MMRAVVLRDGELVVDDVPEPPPPGPGQLLVETVACGICGSDLHTKSHTDQFLSANRAVGNLAQVFDPGRDVVMGHELSFRVLQTGDGVEGWKPGDAGTGYPVVTGADGAMRTVGYSNDYPGGYGERMVLDAAVCLRLPDGADPVAAALTEPFTVGEVSVRRAQIEPGTVAVVLGCGPVGLGIVSALARHGVHPIIATEPTPLRRSKAETLGADTTLDPTEASWVDAYLATGSTQPPIVFNTTGRKGMLNRLFYESPWYTHIFEVSGLMEDDQITPIVAVTKQLRVTFSSDGSLDALASVLEAIAGGQIDTDAVVTGRIGLEEVPEAFRALERPNDHVKVVVLPTNERISG
jgi:threonine dehydrogenase-like Zn-dependent dehydrogenase